MTSGAFFFCGVGGSGMSALASVLLTRGFKVSGSDRSRDQGQTPEKFARLEKSGIRLFPQDGSGVDESIDVVVVSTAVEESIPDIQAARRLATPVRKRADILAELFNGTHGETQGIAVGGTSGKSTVTAMIAHILEVAGLDPTVINGAPMANFMGREAGLGNTKVGQGAFFVIEADESDGSIALYNPAIAVLTNITLDHKPVAETVPLFTGFLQRASRGAVVNLDDPGAAGLCGLHPRTLTFSTAGNKGADFQARDIKLLADGSAFTVQGITVTLNQPGLHNIANALAAMGAVSLAGVSLEKSAQALPSFKGISRRLECVGQARGITVIDDFAHNPDKVAASLAALKVAPGRLIVMFQPHGFGPMKLMGREIMKSFAAGFSSEDILLMSDIFYAGGTADKSLTSADLIEFAKTQGVKAFPMAGRDDIRAFIAQEARSGDRIVIMGARDDTLPEFARAILVDLS